MAINILSAKHEQSGFFSMVGLIVVVIIIGALFVMIGNYYHRSGAEKTVNQVTSDAIDTALRTDLMAASMQLKLYFAQNDGVYPEANDCAATPAANTICLKTTNVNQYTYEADNSVKPPTFSLVAQNSNGASYKITDSKSPFKLTSAQ